jgi:hypothetical protein
MHDFVSNKNMSMHAMYHEIITMGSIENHFLGKIIRNKNGKNDFAMSNYTMYSVRHDF